MEGTIETSCSRECQYLFNECEADGTPGGECRVYYNDCVEECMESVINSGHQIDHAASRYS